MRVFSCESSGRSWPDSDCVGHASGSEASSGPDEEGEGCGMARGVGGGGGGATSSAAGLLARPRRLGVCSGTAMSCMVCVCVDSSGGRAISMSGRERRPVRRAGSVVRGATGVTTTGARAAGLGAVPTMRAGAGDEGLAGGVEGLEGGTDGLEGGAAGIAGATAAGGAAEGRTGGGAADGRTGGGAEGCIAGGGGGGVMLTGPTMAARSAAAFASSRARSSASASDADSAARRSHLSASLRSPRAYMASAVDSAQATSSESSFLGGGMGTEPALVCAMLRKVRPPRGPRQAELRDATVRRRTAAAMHVTVNGASREVPEGVTVRALVELLGLAEGPVAVEVNREIVPRARHAEHRVADGDVIEVVHFVGGG